MPELWALIIHTFWAIVGAGMAVYDGVTDLISKITFTHILLAVIAWNVIHIKDIVLAILKKMHGLD